MSTSSHSRAVKCLNTGPGRRRFTFKTFSEKVDDIDINVWRSFEKLKPPHRSSHFLDCLVEWRELNTAEDFITFYEEMIPYVQTLPLLILHRELILSKLLSNLHMKAHLSLEPILSGGHIQEMRCVEQLRGALLVTMKPNLSSSSQNLRLIAALSRDLQKDFLCFLGRVADSFVTLLKGGADREPEIIEQIIVSWSHIMMYLKENLVKGQMIIHVLEVTRGLRYYSKEYVQEFMADATAFLLRSSPGEQFKLGIREVMLEVGKEQLALQKSGVSALLYYIMRGTSLSFHSKAKWILKDLVENSDDSVLAAVGKFDKGPDTVIEVLTTTFHRLCEEQEPVELNDILNCLYQKIDDCVAKECLLHLRHLLSLLIPVVQINNDRRFLDFQPVLQCAKSLVEKFILDDSFANRDDMLREIIDKALQLMLCILEGLNSSNDIASMSRCSLQWAPVFELRNPSFLTFIDGLLETDMHILNHFRVNVLRAMNNLIDTSQEEAMHLLFSFCERLQMEPLRSSFFNGISEEGCAEIRGLFLKIHSFFQGAIASWIEEINGLIDGNTSSSTICESKLAQLWGATCSYPWLLETPKTPSLLMDLIDVLDRLLTIEAENIAGVARHTWESLLGAVLHSYYECGKKSGLDVTGKFLHLAEKYKFSSQVLSAVANYLDYVHGPILEGDTSQKVYHLDFDSRRVEDAVHIFADNLYNPDKGMRVSTLRILCHYEYEGFGISIEDQPPQKKRRTEVSETGHVGDHGNKVLNLFLLIEKMALSPYSSTEVLFSKIRRGLSSGTIAEPYIPAVLCATIGIFHNRFSDLWRKASECLVGLLDKYLRLTWGKFVCCFEHCQSSFHSSPDKLEESITSSDHCSGLVERFKSFVAPTFESTPYGAVLSSLLQSLQKIPSVTNSRSCQIMTWFLKFLGYDNSDLSSVGSFNSDTCKGKEWKGILKEWLNLLKLISNPNIFEQSHFVKDILAIRLVDENDVEVQMKALECLITWKLDFVIPYEHHLRNLIVSKALVEELTTWSLSRELHLIEEGHRDALVKLVILLLLPKVRKPKLLGAQKHASMHHRKAIIRFIAQLDVNEISLFFALLMKPLLITPSGDDTATKFLWNLPKSSMNEFQPSILLEHFTMEKVMALSMKQKSGFLHVIEDVLRVFDESCVIPFLDLLIGCAVRVLESCTSSLNSVKGTGSASCKAATPLGVKMELQEKSAVSHAMTSTIIKQLKDTRSMCLRIVSLVLNEYDHHDFGEEFWDLFFKSVKPSIDSFKKEGSSSEKPSSLFSCFLAMSRSYHLVHQLCREKNLVSDIFAILTVPTASDAIISCVLMFIENLVNLGNEVDGKGDCVQQGPLANFDSEENAIQKVLLPNLDGLINSLHYLFHSGNVRKRKFGKYPGHTHVRIFKFLSKFIKDQMPARKFVDICLQLLATRVKDPGSCVACLEVVRDMIPVVGNEITSKILRAVSPLLAYVGPDVRLCICDLLVTLAKSDPSVLRVANLLHELNATSAVELDGLDYDVINKAYEQIRDENFFHTIQEDHAVVILSHCVYDMSSDALILRHNACGSLTSFVKFCGRILGAVDGHCEATDLIVANSSWSRSIIQRVINKFLMGHVAYALKSGSSVRKEWFGLLREMVLNLPKLENLRSLSSSDDEQDFFRNIAHLQMHRRARAVLRFKDTISKVTVSEGILRKTFVPLFFNMLLGVQDGKGEQIKAACMKAISSIAACMKWKSYHALLNMCFREMNKSSDKQKVLLRLICSVLDEFHFGQICSSLEVKGSLSPTVGTDGTVNSSIPMLQACGSSTSTAISISDASEMATEIQAYLHKTLFPKIQAFLDSDSDKVNVGINVAVLKVLKLLPSDVMDSQLPTIIHRITNHLKNRLESVRDEARRALADCLKELGPEYLQFVVKVLRGSLKRGYQLHVLGYTLNFLLLKLLPNLENGRLDYCLEDLLSVVKNDILGDVGEEKEVGKIASKMKETKKLKSFETLKMIAQSLTFKSHSLRELISPVRDHMEKHLTPKLKTKLENMLNNIAAGIECNPSVAQTDLFVSIYALLSEDDGVSEKDIQEGTSDKMVACIGQRSDIHEKTLSFGKKSVYSHLITMFALGLFQNRLKSLRLDKNDRELLSLLDPFVRLLGSCLSSEHGDVVSASLRCLAPLVRLPLPSLASQADKVKVTLLDIAQSSVNADTPLLQSCLSLLTVLMRSTEITLSSDQSRLLIQFPVFVDLERSPSFVALSLLKAIVGRKPVVHEMFAVIPQVEKLMVTSQEESIRKKCSQILWKFLRDNHLSGKAFLKHYNFLLNNLSYEYSAGREAVLEMLHLIINNLSESFLVEHGKTSFVRLVVCLANDTDNKVRTMIGSVIKQLIGCVVKNKVPDVLHFIIDSTLSWYTGEKQQLQSSGAQVLGLLVEVMNESFEGHIIRVLPASRNILQSAVNISDETVSFWKEAYYSLVLLEKILHHFHDWCFGKEFEDIWEAICELLSHPHTWLRNISSRLVAFYFASVTKGLRENLEGSEKKCLLLRPSRLFMIAVSLCHQLKTQAGIDDVSSNLIAGNLSFAIHSLMCAAELADVRPHEFWSALEQHEQGQLLKGFQFLDSRKERGILLSMTSGIDNHDNDSHAENLRGLLVSNLLKEMGRIALQTETNQMKIIFNCMGKILSQIRQDGSEMNQDDLKLYASDMLPSLCKVRDGFAGKVIPDDLKQLAEDVCASIEKNIGSETYKSLWDDARKNQKVKRDKRKREEKLLAVVNPMRNAKRKLRIAAKHRAHKKRKITTMKVGRWRR